VYQQGPDEFGAEQEVALPVENFDNVGPPRYLAAYTTRGPVASAGRAPRPSASISPVSRNRRRPQQRIQLTFFTKARCLGPMRTSQRLHSENPCEPKIGRVDSTALTAAGTYEAIIPPQGARLTTDVIRVKKRPGAVDRRPRRATRTGRAPGGAA